MKSPLTRRTLLNVLLLTVCGVLCFGGTFTCHSSNGTVTNEPRDRDR